VFSAFEILPGGGFAPPRRALRGPGGRTGCYRSAPDSFSIGLPTRRADPSASRPPPACGMIL